MRCHSEENGEGDHRQGPLKGGGRALGRSGRGTHDGVENRCGPHHYLQRARVPSRTPPSPPLEEREATARSRGRRTEGVCPDQKDGRLTMSRLLRHRYVLPRWIRQRRGEMLPLEAHSGKRRLKFHDVSRHVKN